MSKQNQFCRISLFANLHVNAARTSDLYLCVKCFFLPINSPNDSILHDIATPFAYVIAPVIGVVAWQFAAAAVTGFIAKENVVGTLAVCFGISNFFSLEDLSMIEGAAPSVAAAFQITKVAALAYLMFNLFTPPCFAAIGAMNAEMKSRKWFWAGIGLQLAVGFTISFLVFFFGTLFVGGSFGSIWMPIVGWAVVLAIAFVVGGMVLVRDRKQKAAMAQKAMALKTENN